MANLIRNKEYNITKDLSESEKTLGVDLKLSPEGDLEMSNLKDFKLVAGGQNAAQAVRLKLEIEPGGLVYHPEIGTDLRIGEKTSNAFEIKMQILSSLSSDERFENVAANVTVLGGTILVDLRVTLKSTGIEVPLQFSVVG
jgi:hypothetical protein